MTFTSTRPTGVYKFDSTLGDYPGTVSVIDRVDYQKGILHLKGIQAGAGIKLSVADADNNVFNTTERKIMLELDGELGEVTTYSSLGNATNGPEIIGSKVGSDLTFKRIKNGAGITILDYGSYLEIASVANGAGEANDGQNIGTLGVGVYDHKEGANLTFRNIASIDPSITVALDGNNNITLSLNPSNISLSDLSGTIQSSSVSGLSTVATSGSYTDLLNKPTLFDGDYNHLYNKPTLFSGNYNELYNKPVVLSQAQVEDIIGAMVSGNVEDNITVVYDNVNRKLNFNGGLSLSGDSTPSLGGDLNVGAYSIVGDVITLQTTSQTGVVVINGVEYSGKNLAIIHDNQVTPQTFYSATAAAYEAIILDYIITRGTDVRMGSLSIINNGYTAAYSDAGPEIGVVGVDFNVELVGNNVEVGYTSSNTGVDGEISFMVRRWDAN